MKNLLAEMCKRFKYLESLEKTPDNESRLNEITLAIVRVQQILLKRQPRDIDVRRKYIESGIDDNAYNWYIWKMAFDLGWEYRGKREEKQ